MYGGVYCLKRHVSLLTLSKPEAEERSNVSGVVCSNGQEINCS